MNTEQNIWNEGRADITVRMEDGSTRKLTLRKVGMNNMAALIQSLVGNAPDYNLQALLYTRGDFKDFDDVRCEDQLKVIRMGLEANRQNIKDFLALQETRLTLLGVDLEAAERELKERLDKSSAALSPVASIPTSSSTTPSTKSDSSTAASKPTEPKS